LGITGLALLAYATSSPSARAKPTADRGIRLEPAYTLPLALTVLAIPSLVAWQVYEGSKEPIQRPSRPHGPSLAAVEITVHGEKIDLVKGESPSAPREDDAKAFASTSPAPHDLLRNCFYCHATRRRRRHVRHAVNPVPANFQDSACCPTSGDLLFWRIAKAAPAA